MTAFHFARYVICSRLICIIRHDWKKECYYRKRKRSDLYYMPLLKKNDNKYSMKFENNQLKRWKKGLWALTNGLYAGKENRKHFIKIRKKKNLILGHLTGHNKGRIISLEMNRQVWCIKSVLALKKVYLMHSLKKWPHYVIRWKKAKKKKKHTMMEKGTKLDKNKVLSSKCLCY